MTTFFGCLFVALAIQQTLTLTAMYRSARFLRSAVSRLPNPTTPNVAIVIPVLREQVSIEGALAHLSSLRYPKLRIVVVSTEREGPVGTYGSPMEALERLSHQYEFAWLHYPVSNGTKADQINYAVDHLLEVLPD